MVYPVCIGCSSGIRYGQKFKVGDGLGKLFWSVRRLSRVNSNDFICQQCQLMFVRWTKETNENLKTSLQTTLKKMKLVSMGKFVDFLYYVWSYRVFVVFSQWKRMK